MFQTLSSADLVKTLEAKHINIDEMHYTDVHAIIAAQKETVVKGTAAEDGKVPETFARTKLYLQQHILNFMHSETDDALHDQFTAQGSVPDDHDDFPRFMRHEIQFRGVPHNKQLA